MNSADIIGWIINNDETYCPDCSPTNEEGPDAGMPIFADSETDSFTHCAECEELIPESPTRTCVNDAIKRMKAYLVRREGRPEILRQWAEHLHLSLELDEDFAVRELMIEAADEANVKITHKNLLRGMEGLKAALDKAGECPECDDPTCSAVRIIKGMINV